MCIAIPGKVTKILNNIAYVSYPNGIKNRALIAEIKPKMNDYVLVQMGIIIKVISRNETQNAINTWKFSYEKI